MGVGPSGIRGCANTQLEAMPLAPKALLSILPFCAGLVAASPNAAITADPSTQYLSAAAGSNPTIEPITVTTIDGTASWTASATAPWVVLSAKEGVGFTTITVSAETSGVTPGLYTDTVRFQLADGRSAGVILTLRLGPSPTSTGSEWHVTPNGTASGDGTAGRPWDIVTALNGGNGWVAPGDTIWL